jgi:nucleotide-binding universal stress UspA family protein
MSNSKGTAPRYKRVLVPVDGSATSDLGLREAIGFAKTQKARLQLVHVVDAHSTLVATAESGVYMADLIQALTQRGRRILEKAADLACKAGLACDTVLLETPHRSGCRAYLAAGEKGASRSHRSQRVRTSDARPRQGLS